jgi:hypothetical protein
MTDDDAQHDDEAPEAQTGDTTEPAETATAPDETSDPLAKVRHEAAGYRRRLRETEQHRDQLAGNLQAMQRAEVERLAADGLRGLGDGGDLWRAGTELGDVLDPDTGAVDPERVDTARAAVLEQHPHWAASVPDFDGGARQTVPAPADFADTLRKAAGG